MAFSTIPLEITTGEDLIGPTPIPLPDGTTETLEHADGPEPIWLTLFSSMFMHGGWAHLGGNMLFLFIFGDNVERRLGSHHVHRLLSRSAASLASFAQIVDQIRTRSSQASAHRARSAACSPAYLVYFPQNKVRVLVGFRYVTEVPALMMIGLWALLQFISGIGSIAVTDETTGGVAYWAHIGGFVAGLVLAFVLRAFGRGPTRPFATA